MANTVESVAQSMAVDASEVKNAAEGVVNEAAAAGLIPKNPEKIIKKLINCVSKHNKDGQLEKVASESIDFAVEKLDKITEEFSDVKEVTKSQISKKIEKIIKEFQNKLKGNQKFIQCVIEALPKELTNMNYLDKKFTSKAIGQNRIARIIGKKTIMSDFPNTIEIRDLGDKIKKIKPMVKKELDPIVNASNELTKATSKVQKPEDLPGLAKDLKSAINTLNGGGSGGSGGLGDDMGADLGGDSGSGTDLSGDKEPGSNPISDFSESARKMHEQGTLKDYLNSIIESVGLYFGVFFLLLTMPAMPVIFYLSILYNVILLTWEKFKGLDTYQ